MPNTNDQMQFLGGKWSPAGPSTWLPSDNGFLAWTFDPIQSGLVQNLLVGGAAGTLQFVKLKIPAAATITNVHLWITVVGALLTAGQNFMALYDSAGALLKVTADQAANWSGATGLITMPFASTYAAAAGTYYVGFWWNGITPPTVLSGVAAYAGVAQGALNAGLAAPNLRQGTTANVGLTVAAPNPFGAQAATAAGVSYWVALS